jgi:hypothetical protein
MSTAVPAAGERGGEEDADEQRGGAGERAEVLQEHAPPQHQRRDISRELAFSHGRLFSSRLAAAAVAASAPAPAAAPAAVLGRVSREEFEVMEH